jgi:hypothetical protein
MPDPLPVSSPSAGEVVGPVAPGLGLRPHDDGSRGAAAAGDRGASEAAAAQPGRELQYWIMRWEGEGGRLAPEHSSPLIQP